MTKLSMSEEEMLKRKYTRPYEKKIEELEKENSGLKARLNAINSLTPELEKMSKLKKQQLSKATEIIKALMHTPTGCIQYYDLYKIAEQFLRETDIDNAIQKANEGLDLDKIADEVEQDIKEQKIK